MPDIVSYQKSNDNHQHDWKSIFRNAKNELCQNCSVRWFIHTDSYSRTAVDTAPTYVEQKIAWHSRRSIAMNASGFSLHLDERLLAL